MDADINAQLTTFVLLFRGVVNRLDAMLLTTQPSIAVADAVQLHVDQTLIVPFQPSNDCQNKCLWHLSLHLSGLDGGMRECLSAYMERLPNVLLLATAIWVASLSLPSSHFAQWPSTRILIQQQLWQHQQQQC